MIRISPREIIISHLDISQGLPREIIISHLDILQGKLHEIIISHLDISQGKRIYEIIIRINSRNSRTFRLYGWTLIILHAKIATLN